MYKQTYNNSDFSGDMHETCDPNGLHGFSDDVPI